jgi:hypothetical protein
LRPLNTIDRLAIGYFIACPSNNEGPGDLKDPGPLASLKYLGRRSHTLQQCAPKRDRSVIYESRISEQSSGKFGAI